MNRSILQASIAMFLVSGALPLTATPVLAGAWTQSAGHGQAIVTATFTRSTHEFDGNGHAVPTPTYDKLEVNALTEYGATDWLTVILLPQTRTVSIAAPTDANSSGFGYTELGGRARLWANATSVFSAQVTGRIPGQSDKDNPADVGATDWETDMRLLAGHSFTIGTWKSFFDAQGAYRVRNGDAPNEIRADFTLGVRPVADWLLLFQSFNTIADGSAKGEFDDGREHKLQLTAVWDVMQDWSLQLGGIATVAGEYTLRERGVVAAVWHRF